jgi:16S rRNA (guanine527-N7)-methyltransferase
VTGDRAGGLAFIGVISQTEARLHKYVEFLARRRKVSNLTSERAFSQVWTRHLADCAQLLGYAPFRSHVGRPRIRRRFSGAGRSNLVGEMQGRAEVHCLESDQRKCAFLREVARGCSCPIHGGRIEMFDPCLLSLVDAITSRALAPLLSLVELANELLMLRATGILPRGGSAAAQTETISVASQFQFKSFRNNFDPDARIDCVHSRAQAQK